MERFLDKIELFTLDTINKATTERELEDIYTYSKTHNLLTGNILMTFLKNSVTPESLIEDILENYCSDIAQLNEHALLFLAANPNTPTPILEQIAELNISDQIKKRLLDNPGTPYSVKEALDGNTYHHSGFCL